MLRRQRQIHAQIRRLVDGGLFGLSFYLAHWLRSHWPIEIFGGTAEIQPFESFIWLWLVVIPLGPIALHWQGFYNRPLVSSRRLTAWQIFQACAVSTVMVIMVMFLLKVQLSRSVILFFGVITCGVLLVKEQVVRSWMLSRLGQAQLKRRFILVGSSADNARFDADFRTKPYEGISILAQLDLNQTDVEDLVDLLHDHSANGVILNAKHTFFGQIEKAIQICELEGVEAWLLADFFKTQISHTVLDDFGERPMLVFRCTPEESWQGVAKQVLDIVAAFVALVSLCWLFALISLLIKWTSRGPVFFRQQRSGLNGQPFTMLKFRSMVSDAEQRKHELAALNEMNGPVFKVTDDPRITPIGRWLRKYSLDELPQLWNVLRGEMSLVGPRPLPVDEVKRFDDLAHRRRLSVKPGLTCLWQISGRNNVTDFKDWVRLDLEYIDNWSLWLDLKILARTIPVVLSGSGAK